VQLIDQGIQMTKRVALIVDDEQNVVSSIKRSCRREDFEVLTALSGPEALAILDENEVQVLVSDQRMPEMTGDALFQVVEHKHPHITRVLLTGYTALEGITRAVNNGSVYKIIYKPWHNDDLLETIRSAFEYHDIRRSQTNNGTKNIELAKNLEQKVHELNIYNHRLEISMRLANLLPIALLGVTDDYYIVESNNKSNELFKDQRMVGLKIKNALPEELVSLITNTNNSNFEEPNCKSIQIKNKFYYFTCIKIELNSDMHSFLVYAEEE